MKRCALLGIVLAVAGAAQTASKAAGHWQGKIRIPDHELGITVDLDRNAKGAWIGSMSVTGSSAADVPLGAIAVDETAVRFTASLPELASFEGRLSADGGTLSGTASNSAGNAPFELTRSGAANVKTPLASSALSKEFEGSWEATLDTGGRVRRVGLRMTPAADGTAAAVLIAIDQGNLEIPVSTVTIQGKDVQLEARAVSGTYRGTLNADCEIAGEWAEGANKFPVTFKRVAGEARK